MTAESLFSHLGPLLIAASIMWLCKKAAAIVQKVDELTHEVKEIKTHLDSIDKRYAELDARCRNRHGAI